MEAKQILSISFLGFLSLIRVSGGGKIFLKPPDFYKNSVLRNIENIAAILAENGHEIHILANDAYNPLSFLTKVGIKLITYPRPAGVPRQDYRVSLIEATENTRELMVMFSTTLVNFCEGLASSNILKTFEMEKYDLIMFDSLDPCKVAVAGYFDGIPSVEFFTFDGMSRAERQEFPMPLSYLPVPFLEAGVNMTFLQRTENVLSYIGFKVFLAYLNWDTARRIRKHGIEPKQPSSLGIVLGGFPVEYPAPTLPDMVYLNGMLTVSQPKPIDTEMEKFIQSSDENGVIIVSLGSMILEYGEKYDKLFAEALGQIPQKVIWKHYGPTPKQLGNNTKVLEWLPQTSLLAHPKIKAFVTHGGINSAYETIYYGVPVIVLPVLGDQSHNAAKMATFHELGIRLDLKTMTVETLVSALHEVIENPKYRKNAKRMSAYLKDQPISTKELLLYWVNYVIRHNGVDHLKPYGRLLPWYQFYLLDVILCITIFVVLSLIGIYYGCKLSCHVLYTKCCKITQKSKSE